MRLTSSPLFAQCSCYFGAGAAASFWKRELLRSESKSRPSGVMIGDRFVFIFLRERKLRSRPRREEGACPTSCIDAEARRSSPPFAGGRSFSYRLQEA